MLRAIAHGSAIRFGEPQSGVVGCSHEVIAQMRQAALQLELMNRRDETQGYIQSKKLLAALRKATMVIVSGLLGRESVLAHELNEGDQRLPVKGGREGKVSLGGRGVRRVSPDRMTGGGRERIQPALSVSAGRLPG